MNNYVKLRNSLLLLLTAAIWGVSFVAQAVGVEQVKPFTFNGLRLLLGGLTLLPVILIRSRMNPSLRSARESSSAAKPEGHSLLPGTYIDLKAGILCGVILFVASNLQTFGLQYTTAGKSGFITTFYIIMVPVISLFFGQKNTPVLWISVVIALVGLYLISIKEGFQMGRGEFLTLLCAFAYTAHILVIDHYAASTDGVRMSCIQFFTAGLLSVVCIILTERSFFSVKEILVIWKPLCYSGILSAGVGYTLQIVGQKGLNPSVASLLMSMESCISAISGWLILGQALTRRELAGCALMFTAIILADFLPFFSGPYHSRHSRRSAND